MKLINFTAIHAWQALRSRLLHATHFFISCKWLLIALLIFSFAHSMARLFWLLLPEPGLKPVTQSSHQPHVTGAADSRKIVDIETLKTLTLFDEPPKASGELELADTAPIVEKETAETSLDLNLNGVFVSSDSSKDHAIITQGKKQSLYRVNEELVNMNGVKLISVLTDRVIIDNNGKNEAILLYPQDGQFSPSDAVHYEDTLNREVSGNTVNTFAQELKSQRLTDIIKISMARENGAMVGFRIRPGRNRQVFDSLGLQTNDIVTAVNGTELTDSKVAMEVYRSMRNVNALSVQVKRGDEQFTLNIDLAALGQGN